MRKSIPIKILFLTAFFLFLFTGCTEDPPVIEQVFWQFDLFHDVKKGTVSDILTLFVMASDSDGWEDAESLYLINDDAELFWKISKEDLKIEEYGENEIWLGSSCIMMPDGGHIPGGDYRIILIDSAGERDEISAALTNNIIRGELCPRFEDVPSSCELCPPAAEAKNRIYKAGTADFIWEYDSDNNFLKEYDGRENHTFSSEKGSGFYLYKYLPEKGFGIISGPF